MDTGIDRANTIADILNQYKDMPSAFFDTTAS